MCELQDQRPIVITYSGNTRKMTFFLLKKNQLRYVRDFASWVAPKPSSHPLESTQRGLAGIYLKKYMLI